jgi:hypothetical protein
VTRPVVLAEGVLRLLRALAGARAVVLEDLHWADPDTLAVVEYLVDNVGDQDVLGPVTALPGAGVARWTVGHLGYARAVVLGREGRPAAAAAGSPRPTMP